MTERPDDGETRPPDQAPEAGVSPDEEPNTTGTLFVMLLFMMALVGMWALMYMVLLER